MAQDRIRNSASATVLVIDDSDVARAEMTRVLGEAGLNAIGLASPIGATRAIVENGVDAVVIDVLMPSLRGDRLAGLLRQNPRFANLAVILVSGESQLELQRLLGDGGADVVVSKSNLRELAPAVKRALKSREGQRNG